MVYDTKASKVPISQNLNMDFNVGRKPEAYLTSPLNYFFLQILFLADHLSLTTWSRGGHATKWADARDNSTQCSYES